MQICESAADLKLQQDEKLSLNSGMRPHPSTQLWPWLSGPQHAGIFTGVHAGIHVPARIESHSKPSGLFLILIDDCVYLRNNNPQIPPSCQQPPSLHVVAPDSSPHHSTGMKMILETKWDLKFCVWQAAWWKGFIAGLDPWKFYANNTAGQAI